MVFSSGETRKSRRETPLASIAKNAALARSAILEAVVGLMGAGIRRWAEAMPACFLAPDSYLSEKVRVSVVATGCSQTEVCNGEPAVPKTEMLISLKPSADCSTITLRSNKQATSIASISSGSDLALVVPMLEPPLAGLT